MGKPNTASLAAPVTNIHAGSTEDNVEVHAVDANAGVIPGGGDNYSNEIIIGRYERVRRLLQDSEASRVPRR